MSRPKGSKNKTTLLKQKTIVKIKKDPQEIIIDWLIEHIGPNELSYQQRMMRKTGMTIRESLFKDLKGYFQIKDKK